MGSVFTTSIMKDYRSRLALLYLMLFIHVCQVYAQDDAESGSSDGGSAAAAGGGGEEGTESPQEQERNAAEEGSGSGDSTDTARSYWDRLPADTRRELARQEFVSFEANKQFQMYLKALILEAKNMHQKNYLEFM